MSLHERIVARIRAHGPITVAEFMSHALYDPERGYYATSPQRSGARGDFITSVDAGPMFGEMIAVQLAEMWGRLGGGRFDLVEAGAGNGRLARDILDAAAEHHPDVYASMRVTLVEASLAARQAQTQVLAAHADRIADARPDLPASISGAIVGNELLDALPVHVVTGTSAGLQEVLVTQRCGRLAETTGPISDPRIRTELTASGITVAPGVRCEVSLAMTDWIGSAARALKRGFILLFDYALRASELQTRHPDGTLLAYFRHMAGAAHWLEHPGERDLTAHVNLDALRAAAARAGLDYAGAVDQTYFLASLGIAGRLPTTSDAAAVARRLAAKTLLIPGGLGSTMKAMAFSRNVDVRPLRGFSEGRLT